MIQFDVHKRSSNGVVVEFCNFLPGMPVPNVVSSDGTDNKVRVSRKCSPWRRKLSYWE